MTANQINYWNLQETGRHNLATETETNRHNVVTEGIDLGKLNETRRHNLVTEGQTDRSLDLQSSANAEIARHNQASEAIDLGRNVETKRHNIASEGLSGVDLSIKQDQVQEQYRHNVSTEAIDKYEAKNRALEQQANAAYTDAKRTWESLLNSSKVEMTNAQRTQVQHLIAKVESEIERAKVQNTTDTWNAANRTAEALAKLVDAFIPG